MGGEEIVSMCEKLAGRYKSPQHYDDLVSEGILACYEALAEDEDAHPAHLWRMASRRMYDYLNIDTAPLSVPKSDTARKVARGSGEHTGHYSDSGIRNLEEALRGDVVGLDDFMAFVPDHAEEYERKDFIGYVITVAIETLSYEEMFLVKRRYFDGMTQEELAIEDDTTKMTISRREAAALEKLRNNL